MFSVERLLYKFMPLVNEIAQLESLILENQYHDIVHAYGVRISKLTASIGVWIQPPDPIQ